MEENVTKLDLPEETKYKSVNVDKIVDLNIDLGTLLAVDRNDLDREALSKDKNRYLTELARDNTQLLFTAIWGLPTTRVDEAIVVTLPEPTTRLPREKPVPKPRPLTKWQQFAKDKGIRTKKKSTLTWDEVLKKWVPRHGYKRAAAEKEKDWIIEIPDNADPYIDYFEKKSEDKKEKVAKNEFQRLRNLAKAKKIKVPSMGLPPTEKMSSLQLNSAANIADVSTASLGKFQPKLSKEKHLSKSSILTQKKRKQPLMGADQERRNQLDIVDGILKKKPKLDLEKVVNKEIQEEQRSVSEEKKNKRTGKRKTFEPSKKNRGKNKKFGGKVKPGGAKPGGGKGKRTMKGGRKRR